MRRRLLVVSFCLASSVLSPQLARAECITRTAKEVLEDPHIELVFSGTVTVVTRTAPFGYRATFAVDRVWKGAASSPFAVYVSETAPETPRFEIGRTYVVQARRMLAPDARRRVGVTADDTIVFTPVGCSDEFTFPPTLDNLRALGPDVSKQPVILLAGCDTTQHVMLSIDNVGGQDTAVMIGVTLGNGGRYLVTALTLRTDLSDGRTELFRYLPADYPAVVGGTLGPWVVPLPVGSSYALRVSPSQFMAKSQAGGLGKRLTDWPSAELSFELALQIPNSNRGDVTGMKLFRVWRGVEALTSNRIRLPGDCR